MKTFLEFINESHTDLESFLGKILPKDEFWFTDINKLCIEVNKINIEKVISVINTVEKKYNYYLASGIGDLGDDTNDWDFKDFKKNIAYNLREMSKNYEDFEDDEEIFTLIFEPKLGKEFPDIPNIVYHITDESKLKNIKIKGLLPKNISKIAYHPKRIYFLKDKEDCEDLLKKMKFIV